MKRYFLFLFSILNALVAFSSEEPRNYTVIVSLDGFRADYKDWYKTPVFDDIEKKGVSATMLPSFPASTFPNHYTLATGLTPDHHGIVNNSFWDKSRQVKYSLGDSATRHDISFYGGEPIWITAQKQGLKVGTVYWVGSDLNIQNTDPTYFMDYQKKPLLSFEERVDSVIAWLSKPEGERPHLIMSYYEEPDHVGHMFSPRGEETKKRVEELDKLMGKLRKRISKLPHADRINLIITSDHGMATISKDKVVSMKKYVKDEWIDVLVNGTPTSIFTKEGCQDSVYNALRNVPHLHVWKREEIPAEVGYGTNKDRIGDVVVSPEVGWLFGDFTPRSLGAHGYLPSDTEMQVMFVAEGPDFKKGYKSDKFVNVDVYNMLSRLLKIKPAPTDGVDARIEGLFAQ